MSDDDHDENPVERRPAFGYGRPSDTAVAMRSLAKHRAEVEARQRARRGGGLTIAEARERMKKHAESW
jgi:hypothetical protein